MSVAIHVTRSESNRDVVVGHWVTDAGGAFVLSTSAWKSIGIIAVTDQSPTYDASSSATLALTAAPQFAPVQFPQSAALPHPRFADAPPAIGQDAHPVISPIPNDVWTSMQGLSWHAGCLARSSLRYITVNYIGFDGYRYRGKIVLASRVSKAAANAFTALYKVRYPIRSMFLVDRFGHSPSGYPGADDRASMRSDNTSGFNCRYVVGKERQGSWSPHASGVAIDINTWENPYVSARGTFPDTWWLNRSIKSSPVLRSGTAAVRAFAAQGFHWGGPYSDFQHFQI
jgi:hypothetical protein